MGPDAHPQSRRLENIASDILLIVSEGWASGPVNAVGYKGERLLPSMYYSSGIK